MPSTTREIAVDHPCFAGHFPGRPIVPGVLLLAEVVEALRADAATARLLGSTPTLGAVKFLSPATPGARLRIDWEPSATRVRSEVHLENAENQLAATGHFDAVQTDEEL
jgi:3-hydroxymyristoyl/3-hydroxydecanoyl-(acyl carrier protein) dehydratase